jgi:hypothetical protein
MQQQTKYYHSIKKTIFLRSVTGKKRNTPPAPGIQNRLPVPELKKHHTSGNNYSRLIQKPRHNAPGESGYTIFPGYPAGGKINFSFADAPHRIYRCFIRLK